MFFCANYKDFTLENKLSYFMDFPFLLYLIVRKPQEDKMCLNLLVLLGKRKKLIGYFISTFLR